MISRTLRAVHIPRIVFLSFLSSIIFSSVSAQDIKVIKSEGAVAVINGGSNFGFHEGGQVRVMRMRNGMWQEVSRARLSKVTPDMSRIEVIEGAPMVHFKPGDMIVKINLSPRSKISIPAAGISDRANQARNPSQSVEFVKPRGIYVGPTVDMLLPQGDMKDCFDDEVGYGALVGFMFQNSFDISVRFMYASRTDKWNFWDLELLGRVYDRTSLFADFGYSICYPSVAGDRVNTFGDMQIIRMGFVLGGGYPLPISPNKQFEIGFLYHYYPNFGKHSGQFFSLHSRLVLKS
jgi:hypothetical protein